MGKNKKITEQHEFPFELENLDETDMEILNDPLLTLPLKKVGRIIFSLVDDGVGNLIVENFTHVVKLYRDADEDLWIDVKTTEGKKKDGVESIQIFDFKIINL